MNFFLIKKKTFFLNHKNFLHDSWINIFFFFLINLLKKIYDNIVFTIFVIIRTIYLYRVEEKKKKEYLMRKTKLTQFYILKCARKKIIIFKYIDKVWKNILNLLVCIRFKKPHLLKATFYGIGNQLK